MSKNDNDIVGALLMRVALKDRAAFDALYAQMAPKLFGVLLRLLKDRALAEDGLQEVFIKIWQRADRFQTTQSNAMGWLFTLTRHHGIDMIRAQKPVSDDDEILRNVAADAPDPQQSALQKAERTRLDDCLATLQPDKADAVRAAYIEGYAYKELAARYKVPLNTMRTWLRRSLMKLKECLQS